MYITFVMSSIGGLKVAYALIKCKKDSSEVRYIVGNSVYKTAVDSRKNELARQFLSKHKPYKTVHMWTYYRIPDLKLKDLLDSLELVCIKDLESSDLMPCTDDPRLWYMDAMTTQTRPINQNLLRRSSRIDDLSLKEKVTLQMFKRKLTTSKKLYNTLVESVSSGSIKPKPERLTEAYGEGVLRDAALGLPWHESIKHPEALMSGWTRESAFRVVQWLVDREKAQ